VGRIGFRDESAGVGMRLDRSSFAVLVVTSATLVGLGIADGGFFTEARAWATFALAWLLAMIVFVRERVGVRRLEALLVGGLAALAGWAALSATWSGDPDLSLHEAGRILLYAVSVTVVLLLARVEGEVPVLLGVLVGVSVVVLAGLGHYLFLYGARAPDRFEGYLLFEPAGYANAFGILCAIGIVLALGLALHVDDRALRSIYCAALVPLGAALYLTSSRGAWLALAVALALQLLLERRPAWGIVAVAGVGGAIAAWLSARADLDSPASTFDVDAARLLGLELVFLTVAVALVAHRVSSAADRTRAGRHTRARIPIAITVALAALLAAARGDLALGNRRDYWRSAWDQWQEDRLLGGGAGAFGDYWQRATGTGARDAHSLYLETLAELGVIGFALLLAVLATPIVAAVLARRRAFVPTALAAYGAFLVHAGVDWDWEMPVVALSGLFCGAALLVAARRTDELAVSVRTRPWPLLIGALVVALALGELIASGALRV
jgi:O-antigen ligase